MGEFAARLRSRQRRMGRRISSPIRTMRLLLPALLAVAPLSGACTTSPEKHSLGMVALQPGGLRFHILERGVRARHCKAGFGSSGDLGEAVERAVSQVDGAQVVVNASVYAHPTANGVCVEVVGDAAAID